MDRTFISFTSIANKKLLQEKLKFSFLWYEEVLFEDLERYSKDAFLEGNIDLTGLNQMESHSVREAFVPMRGILNWDWHARFMTDLENSKYPRWGVNYENYTYPEPETASQYAHNQIMQSIEDQSGHAKIPPELVMYAEGNAGQAVKNVELWQDIKKELQCDIVANRTEEIAIRAFRDFGSSRASLPPVDLLCARMPQLSMLTWGDLLAVKKTTSFSALKSKLRSISELSRGDLSDGVAALRAAEDVVTQEIIERSRPKPGRTFVEGILGNFPTPFPNPLGIMFAIRAFVSQADSDRKYEWFYVMRDLERIKALSQ